ncbi:MAG: hypothetical protein RLN88_09040 [Ekhidna sp.]|uniref:hypothetical protein n=1 Tax=Ekhidna sp. TaxID=2608089 RepID=UPI0032EDAB21
MPFRLLLKPVSMDEVTLVRQSYQLVRKDFGLEENFDFEEGQIGFDRLEEFLAKQVNYLLDHDLNKLLNALYRIDIPESQVKQLLHYSSQGEIAKNMAKAIIEREKQKVITRQKYQP